MYVHRGRDLEVVFIQIPHFYSLFPPFLEQVQRSLWYSNGLVKQTKEEEAVTKDQKNKTNNPRWKYKRRENAKNGGNGLDKIPPHEFRV